MKRQINPGEKRRWGQDSGKGEGGRERRALVTAGEGGSGMAGSADSRSNN